MNTYAHEQTSHGGNGGGIIVDFLISIAEKLVDWLVALRVKPNIKVIKFEIEPAEKQKKQRIIFSAIVSNNSNKAMSISEKYLLFFNGKAEIAKIAVKKYEIIRKKDTFDELNILTPTDDIITLQAGESRKIGIIDTRENLLKANKIIFSYYTGRKTYYLKLKVAPM